VKTVVKRNPHSHTYEVSIPQLIKRLAAGYHSQHWYYAFTKAIVWEDFARMSADSFRQKYEPFIEGTFVNG